VEQNSVVYACTAKGKGVLKFFKELNQALPITEGDNKNLPIAY
jgi:hypothetical protein